MSKASDLTGQKFARLLALEFAGYKHARRYWKCLCDCGNTTVVETTHLKTGHIKSCGCLAAENRKKRYLGKGVSSFNSLFGLYQKLAAERNLLFTLSRKQFEDLILGCCFYCGIIPNQWGCKKDVLHHGIDRVNNTKGYTIDNCVSCCKTCNCAKSKMPQQEFLDWIERVHNFRGTKR